MSHCAVRQSDFRPEPFPQLVNKSILFGRFNCLETVMNCRTNRCLVFEISPEYNSNGAMGLVQRALRLVQFTAMHRVHTTQPAVNVLITFFFLCGHQNSIRLCEETTPNL